MSAASNRVNLLTFLAKDPNPPISLDAFWSSWDWFVKPLLLSYRDRGFQGMRTLPPLWPNDLFAAHRMHARKLVRELPPAPTPTPTGNDPSLEAARWDVAYDRAAERANELAFGPANVRDSNGEVATSNLVRQICNLNDPLGFPHESAVYETQANLASALEVIERNTNTLEQTRRRYAFDNERAYAEVQRLHGTIQAIERLPVNFKRIINREAAVTTAKPAQ